MPLFDASVVHNREIAQGYYSVEFAWPAEVPAPVPGQFATVRTSPGAVPLLRRPFAFSSFTGDRASLIYWRRGTGTGLLATKTAGDAIDILAPLGTGWPAPDPGATPLLIAGGIGMGPIFYLASALWDAGRDARLLLGARSAALLPELPLFDRGATRRATDDGSAYERGTVMDLLEREYATLTGPAELFACGPTPMLSAVHHWAANAGARAWVSMEQQMGCGVGACMGCAVRVKSGNGYARVCTEGPVFDSTEVIW
jgi:dihydroorotate dehydrogenase electron transfer subunit